MPHRSRLAKHLQTYRLATMLAATTATVAAGLTVWGSGSAATINPYGVIDYCALENNVTVIRGWAAEPN
ncbi:MAG TPA: hypothetical protein VK983_05505, partial [Candidatus Limnocylindrales bacterium]|nr:hypothetical protein [Candidatus Limnocylindrales bacterium]